MDHARRHGALKRGGAAVQVAFDEATGRALPVLRAKKPAGSWELADAESRLGARLAAKGRFDEAAVCLRDSYEALRSARGERAVYTRRANTRLEEFEALRSQRLSSVQ